MIVKDNLYGTIEFNEFEERIINTAEFQRLRRIKQMSVTNLVYPCANHTRFEHSLGTAYLAGLMANRLLEDEDEKNKARLYGLLHDIGHVAFSHEGEDILSRYLGTHEEIGERIISDGEVADIINENYSTREITAMKKSSLGAIVDADIGADRMDYLRRDALNTGVAYGLIDMDRLLHTTKMENGKLCIAEGGLEAAEWLLIARFMMFSTVYLHKTVRIATAMLHKAIEGSLEDGTMKPKDFIWMGDDFALFRMRESKKAEPYVDGLLKRDLFKEVVAIPEKNAARREVEKIKNEIMEKYGCEIIADYPTSFSKPVSLRILKKNGKLVKLEELSEIVASLREAEEKRRKILILVREKDKKKYGKAIIRGFEQFTTGASR